MVPGFDIFRRVGLNLTVLPHWNNTDGGADLDTSHCFMGADRFRYLRRLMPAPTTLLGIDEHAVCVLDVTTRRRLVFGVGNLTIIRGDAEETVPTGESFPMELLRTNE